MRKLTKRDLGVPALLVLLSLVPMGGGIARLVSFAQPQTPESARFLAAPLPVLLHIFSAVPYCVLGAFQFSAGVRARWPRWHRRAGRVLAPLGLVAALSGLWMAQFYAIPGGLQGPLLHAVRWVVGTSMAASIGIAWLAIRRRQVARHEAWMIRAYALGQGAGTQVLVLLPWMLIAGESEGLTRDLLMTLSWAINVALAEWIVRRPKAPRVPARQPGLAVPGT
jgi:uncharacterized membrane protein